MDDDRQKRENEIFREELKKAEDQQAQRDFLKDKSIGGDRALRPSDEFIDANLGKDQNRQEIAAEAAEKTDKRMAREDATTKHLKERERAEKQGKDRGDQKSKDTDPAKDERQKLIDQMRQKREQSRNRKRGR